MKEALRGSRKCIIFGVELASVRTRVPFDVLRRAKPNPSGSSLSLLRTKKIPRIFFVIPQPQILTQAKLLACSFFSKKEDLSRRPGCTPQGRRQDERLARREGVRSPAKTKPLLGAFFVFAGEKNSKDSKLSIAVF